MILQLDSPRDCPFERGMEDAVEVDVRVGLEPNPDGEEISRSSIFPE